MLKNSKWILRALGFKFGKYAAEKSWQSEAKCARMGRASFSGNELSDRELVREQLTLSLVRVSTLMARQGTSP